jgi:hypothetical protein
LEIMFLMLYRLAFGITIDGYLRVSASAKAAPCLLSTVHLNDEVFAGAVRAAGIGALATYRIVEAAREARRNPDQDICCEAVELTQHQIDVLCLHPIRDMVG